MNRYRPELPALPAKMAHLPIDHRGYPVPWFVAWVNGQPDHRIADGRKITQAIKERLCWVCGKRLDPHQKTFVIGPMCAVNRVSGESPSHKECAVYSVTACPFLTRPHAHRREGNQPKGTDEPAGFGIRRNPGVSLLWTTRNAKPFEVHNGILWNIGDPIECLWFAEGREATRDEIIRSIETGLPILQDAARKDGRSALAQLQQMTEQAMQLVPVVT